MKKYKKLPSFFLIYFFALFSFASPFDFSSLSTINPAANTTLLGLQCSGCSKTNPKFFTLALRMSTNANCSNSKSLNFGSTPITTCSPLYLTSTGLNSYTSQITPSMTGIKCVQLYWISQNTSVIALVSGTPYTRYFPTGNASILKIS